MPMAARRRGARSWRPAPAASALPPPEAPSLENQTGAARGRRGRASRAAPDIGMVGFSPILRHYLPVQARAPRRRRRGRQDATAREEGAMFRKPMGTLAAGTLAAALLMQSHGAARADEALDRALQSDNNWPMYGRTYDNQRYSRLKEINDQNVGGLKLAWAFQVGALRSNEASPIVIDGTLYISSSTGPKGVFALDAKTGALKWQYQPDVAADVQPYVCCDVDSRGVSFADGKILFSQLDGYLSALDAKTGKLAWKSKVVDYKDGETNTSPPLIVKNMAIIGFSGGEYGARGALQAYDIASGKQLWKTWTIPGPGEPGHDTWKGDSWQHGGGAPWYVGSYDPKTDTAFYGTSNPAPWNAAVRSTGTSDLGKF